MTANLQSLGIDRLPIEERIALVHEIWDSIAAESTRSMLTESQRRELERRLADDDADPDNLVPWEQVKARAQSRYPK